MPKLDIPSELIDQLPSLKAQEDARDLMIQILFDGPEISRHRQLEAQKKNE